MSIKIVCFFVLANILFSFAPVFAGSQINREDVVGATLDAIQSRLEQDLTLTQGKEQEFSLARKPIRLKGENFFSDFSLQSSLLDAFLLFQRQASPVLSFFGNQNNSYRNYTVLPRIEDQARHAWSLSPEISHIKYEEPGVMEEEGTMYGLSGAYSSYPELLGNRVMLRLEGRLSMGEVDYQNSGSIADIDDLILEFRGTGGGVYPLFDAFLLTPYFGFGYRYLKDDSKGLTSTTGALGYERESNYYYSPIGFELTASLQQGWFLGVTFEYDYFWMGVQESHLRDVSVAFDDLQSDQNDGFGLRGSLKLEKRTKGIDFTFEPFIRYWNIDESEKATISYAGLIWGLGYEPKNNSTEIGARFGLKF